MDTGLVAVILIFGTGLIAVAGGILVDIIKAMKGTDAPTEQRGKNGEPVSGQDEARLIQEIHLGLERMDRRVEALETLLMDSARYSSGETRSYRSDQGEL